MDHSENEISTFTPGDLLVHMNALCEKFNKDIPRRRRHPHPACLPTLKTRVSDILEYAIELGLSLYLYDVLERGKLRGSFTRDVSVWLTTGLRTIQGGD